MSEISCLESNNMGMHYSIYKRNGHGKGRGIIDRLSKSKDDLDGILGDDSISEFIR